MYTHTLHPTVTSGGTNTCQSLTQTFDLDPRPKATVGPLSKTLNSRLLNLDSSVGGNHSTWRKPTQAHGGHVNSTQKGSGESLWIWSLAGVLCLMWDSKKGTWQSTGSHFYQAYRQREHFHANFLPNPEEMYRNILERKWKALGKSQASRKPTPLYRYHGAFFRNDGICILGCCLVWFTTPHVSLAFSTDSFTLASQNQWMMQTFAPSCKLGPGYSTAHAPNTTLPVNMQ